MCAPTRWQEQEILWLDRLGSQEQQHPVDQKWDGTGSQNPPGDLGGVRCCLSPKAGWLEVGATPRSRNEAPALGTLRGLELGPGAQAPHKNQAPGLLCLL